MIAKSEKERIHALFEQGDFAGAEVLCRGRVIAAPGDASAHYNLGVVLVKLGYLEEAMTCYRRTIELDPNFAAAYTNFGFCLNAFNLIAEARQAFAIAHKITPDNPVPVLNEGIAALALGDYAAGWQGFAARWQIPAYAKFKRDFAKPIWNGEDISGKTLFLYAEQGFGDSIQMARFIPLLAARNIKVILEAQPALVRLLQGIQGVSKVIAKGEAVPDFDAYCAMMDIPRVLGIALETIPAQVPYLSVEPASFVKNKKRRVGLCWAGRSSHENDRNRSLSLTQLLPLFSDEIIEWISLQRLASPQDLAMLQTSRVTDWGQNFTDFYAAAAAVMTLDLVITVDTAIAHLAGALGKPTWILLPFYADWRWLTGREDSPWYPTARLFRQKKRGDWAEVIERVGTELKSLPS